VEEKIKEPASELNDFYCEVVQMVPGRDIDWAWRLAILGRIEGLRRLAAQPEPSQHLPARWT
jgi:hypothetical protein